MMTKEEIEAEVRVCRDVVDRYPDRASACDRVASHLADENATLRADNAKLLATLEHSATHKALDALAKENATLRAQLAEAVALLNESADARRSPRCGSTCVAPDDAELSCDKEAGHGDRLCQQASLRVGQRGFRYMWIDNDRTRSAWQQRRDAFLAKLRGTP